MGEKKRPLTPVKPSGMEIICFYPCPFCSREVPLVSPTQPAMVRCDSCGKDFPIVPVDERGCALHEDHDRQRPLGRGPGFPLERDTPCPGCCS
jgi:hypothetical protein